MLVKLFLFLSVNSQNRWFYCNSHL